MKKQAKKNDTVYFLWKLSILLKLLLVDLEESTPKSKHKKYLKPLYGLIKQVSVQLKEAKKS